MHMTAPGKQRLYPDSLIPCVRKSTLPFPQISQYVPFNYGEAWLQKSERAPKWRRALGVRGEQNTHDTKLGGDCW